MALSINDFWKLAVASRLVRVADAKGLHAEFLGVKGAAERANARGLAEWLVAQGKLSRFQAHTLLEGRAGPFVFDDFVIHDCIESGRLAGVYRAKFRGSQEVLFVFASQLGDELAAESIQEQSQAAVAVDSPHVSRVLQYVASEPYPFVVMQDLPGQSLREFLAAHKPDLHTTCHIGFQAALGLVALHEREISHGNVAPENLWLDPAGAVKVLQYPLVRAAPDAKRFEPPLVDYLAPELADPQRPADAQSDVYALGCVLFELLTGQPPFAGGTAAEKLRRHKLEVPPRVDRLIKGVPEELADLIAEMLDKERLLRCPTAAQAAHLLAPFASHARRRTATPPRLDADAPLAGYGVWQAPAWQAPPKQAQGMQPKPIAVNVRPKAPARPEGAAEMSGAAATAPATAAPKNAPPAPSTTQREAAGDARAARNDAGDLPRAAMLKPKASRFSSTALVGSVAGLLIVAMIVLAGWMLSGDEPSVAQPPGVHSAVEAKQTADASATTAKSIDEAPPSQPVQQASGAANYRPIDDDGKTLWAAPAAGEPVSLAHLPAGSQLIVVLRPGELLASAEGQRAWDALGPSASVARQQLETALGTSLVDIDELVVAFFGADPERPQVALRARLAAKTSLGSLLAAWGHPAEAEHKGKHYLVGKDLAYSLSDNDPQCLLVAAKDDMPEILELDGAAIVAKGIEKLLPHTDTSRQFQVLAVPSYLRTHGAALWTGEAARLGERVLEFLDEKIEAVCLGIHLGDAMFVELRAQGTADQRPEVLGQRLRERLDELPGQIEDYVASLAIEPYGRVVLLRFPRMVQLLDDYTRSGADQRQAVLRCYLPANALHNLLLGAQLALVERPGAAAAVAVESEDVTAPTAEMALAKRISLSFPRDTLEHCLELLAKEIDVEISIRGADLQLEGITKNQSFGLDEHDRPAGEVLHKVLSLASPQGKLIYVVPPAKEGRPLIVVTTRAAAAKRDDAIPPEVTPAETVEKP